MPRELILEYLGMHYRGKGYTVAGPKPSLSDMPSGWKGPAPDLYVENGGQHLAILVETAESIQVEENPDRIVRILANPRITVRIMVSDRKDLRTARRLRRRVPLRQRRRIRIFRVIRVQDDHGERFVPPSLDPSEWRLVAALFLALLLLLSLAQKGPVIPWLQEFWRTGIELGLRIYQPKDTERRSREAPRKPQGELPSPDLFAE